MANSFEEQLGTIYEDVADLQARVTALETLTATQQSTIDAMQLVINGLGAQTLAENTDLNALGVGDYVIPSATVCATLLNKPITGNATGFIKVVAGGAAGQLMQYYFPCSKEGASYYQRAFYESAWGGWHEINCYDSGWLDLPLTGDVIAFNEEQKPRYRRVGKMVFLSGVVKNISAFNTVIATLPVNYRPSKKIIIAEPSTGVKFSRISILTTGVITYEQSSDNTVAAGNWHSIACCFNVAD